MNEKAPDRRNYDIASISHPGREKRANYIQDALHINKEKIRVGGEFVKVFADIFLRREVANKAYF